MSYRPRPIWRPDGCTVPSESLLDSQRDFEPEEDEESEDETEDEETRHCCGSCIHHVTGNDGGWGRFASAENPRKTDLCAVCDHMAEGVRMAVSRGQYGGFEIQTNANY